MTRDEQLDWLCRLRSNIQCYMDVATLPDDVRKSFVQVLTEVIEQEPCTDAVSRAELLKAIDTWDKFGVDDTNSLFRLDNLSLPHYVPYMHYDDVIKCIKGMLPVTPKQKTGRWVKISPAGIYECSECGQNVMTGDIDAYRHCHGCGAKMAESEE